MPGLGPPVASFASLAPAATSGPGFDLLLLCHAAAAFLAMATVIVSAVEAYRLDRCMSVAPDRPEEAPAEAPASGELPSSLRRYFSPGTNWAARVSYAVPVLGALLVATSGGRFGWDESWIMIGLGAWAGAIVIGEVVLWPAERRLQVVVGQIVLGEAASAGAVPDRSLVRAGCRAVIAGAAVVFGVLLLATVVMFAKP